LVTEKTAASEYYFEQMKAIVIINENNLLFIWKYTASISGLGSSQAKTLKPHTLRNPRADTAAI
jgi:hypothetical protein